MLSHDDLLKTISYDPESGIFRLLAGTHRRAAGTVLGYNDLAVQRSGTIHRRTMVYVRTGCYFTAGRLAWFYMTGEWPVTEVDHADGDGWNSCWDNLRLATRSQNQANTRRYKSNSSGLKCVFPSGSKRRPWRAQIQKDGRRISLGRFKNKKAAHEAYMAAAVHLHGEFARAA